MLLLAMAISACGGPPGPASTDTASDALPSLERKVEFLERYVTFRRTYRDLGFRISYHNDGGGIVPGPSEWDIRLVALVPAEELEAWIPPGLAPMASADHDWLVGVPGEQLTKGIGEWYGSPGLTVGVDRGRSVVAYRRWTN